MKINKLIINNLRNHISSEFEFGSNINLICGKNGAGKTTILEAISICSISRTFTSASDSALINKSAKEYFVSAICKNDLSVPYKISVSFSPKSQKNISSISGDKLSPDFKNITNGPPEFRRRFIDTILSQSNKFYMEQLFKLKKCLKHRNAILQSAKTNPNIDFTYFEQWTEFYIDSCVDILIRRNDFIREFTPFFINSYNIISNSKEEVSLIYCPNNITKIESKNQLKEELLLQSRKMQFAELQRGTTLFGPQKDELKIILNDGLNNGLARDFASQGQHKSLLIALKFAEFKYLIEKKRETPVILLDDIFSELDASRVLSVLELLEKSDAQIFITSTDPNLIPQESNLKRKTIEINNS